MQYIIYLARQILKSVVVSLFLVGNNINFEAYHSYEITNTSNIYYIPHATYILYIASANIIHVDTSSGYRIQMSSYLHPTFYSFAASSY